jgi:hypothetical protein
LESINIPDGVTSIEGGTFAWCVSLKNITLPDSVTSVGYSAFSNCNSLKSVNIPGSVTNAQNWFANCQSLESIAIPFTVKKSATNNARFEYFFGGGAVNSTTDGAYMPRTLKTVIITGGTVIPIYAFKDCRFLENITLPDSITSIQANAFSGCNRLASITFNGTVEQWNAIECGATLKVGAVTKITCTDGEVAL